MGIYKQHALETQKRQSQQSKMIEQGSLTKADLKAHIQKESDKEAKTASDQSAQDRTWHTN